jgi:glycosyltransferase involved in cell wall biosynthesis
MQYSSPLPSSKKRLPHVDQERLLVVMIPAYNEAENIEQAVQGVASLRPRLLERGLKLKVIVVDDGSADGTAQLAEAAGADCVITHRQNLGLGAAVRLGLEAAGNEGADVFVKLDADLQHNPEDILLVITPIVAGDADLVYGERFLKISYKMPMIRRLGNIAFRGLMRWLTNWPIQDSQPGIFAVSGEYLEIYDIPGDYNYTQQILLDACLKGMRFAQVSIDFEPRRKGKSFVSLFYPFKVLPQIVLVIAMTKPLKIFGTCGVLFLLLGAIVFTIEIGQWMLGAAEKPVTNVNLVLGSLMFGLQMLFFGILAKLVVSMRPSRRRRNRPST